MAFKLEGRGKEICVRDREGRGSWIQLGTVWARCGGPEQFACLRKEHWFPVADIENAHHGQAVNEPRLDLEELYKS